MLPEAQDNSQPWWQCCQRSKCRLYSLAAEEKEENQGVEFKISIIISSFGTVPYCSKYNYKTCSVITASEANTDIKCLAHSDQSEGGFLKIILNVQNLKQTNQKPAQEQWSRWWWNVEPTLSLRRQLFRPRSASDWSRWKCHHDYGDNRFMIGHDEDTIYDDVKPGEHWGFELAGFRCR